MSRKILLLLLLIFGGSIVLFARDKTQQYHPKDPVTPADIDRFARRIQHLSYTPAVIERGNRQELGRTFYDFGTNDRTGRMLARSANGFHFSFMKILPASATRFVTYDYFDNTVQIFFGNQSVDESLGRTGWGRVMTGKNNEAIISFHSSTDAYLYADAAESGYSFSQTGFAPTGTWPGAARIGDTVIFGFLEDRVGGNNPTDSLLVSTDYMQTWVGKKLAQFDLSVPDPNPAEFVVHFNPTKPNEFSYLVNPDSTVTAPNGSFVVVTSPDLGDSYTLTQIISDDDVINSDVWGGPLQYIAENFEQGNSMYSGDGVYHVALGSVQADWDAFDTTDSGFRYAGAPIIYWNSRDQKWLELTSFEHAYPPADSGDAMRNSAPGRYLGNALPDLSEGPDGEIMVVWVQPEFNPDGTIAVVTPAGGANTIWVSDIWGAYSPDGGRTWSQSFLVAGTPGVSDVFPNLAADFQSDADSIYLDLVYLADTNPGVSIFSTPESDPSECIWFYERVGIARSDIIVGIEELSRTTIKDFALAQNYPNPFNPSTTIEYRLKKAAEVTLTVHNLQGQKVATLVSGRQSAGEHKVEFNAANLASGLYFYTLQSGNVELTRKMLLIK